MDVQTDLHGYQVRVFGGSAWTRFVLLGLGTLAVFVAVVASVAWIAIVWGDVARFIGLGVLIASGVAWPWVQHQLRRSLSTTTLRVGVDTLRIETRSVLGRGQHLEFALAEARDAAWSTDGDALPVLVVGGHRLRSDLKHADLRELVRRLRVDAENAGEPAVVGAEPSALRALRSGGAGQGSGRGG